MCRQKLTFPFRIKPIPYMIHNDEPAFYARLARWRHQMETSSALLAICAGNSPVPGEFPAQRPVTRSFHVFFDLRLNKRLSKQWWGWWFETLPRPLWPQCNGMKWTQQVGFHVYLLIMHVASLDYNKPFSLPSRVLLLTLINVNPSMDK